MTDQQFNDLISKLEILAKSVSDRRNAAPVSPADTQPLAAPHNTTDLKAMKERLAHLESDWTDEFNQFLRDEIEIRVNALKEQRKGLTNRLRSDKSLSDSEKQTIRDERDAIVAQIKAIAKKPKQYREQQRLEIISNIQTEEQRVFQQEQRRRYQQNVDVADRARYSAGNAQTSAYENAFVRDSGVIGAYTAESRKAREMRSIMEDYGGWGSRNVGYDSDGNNYWTSIESRFESDASLRKRLDDFKKSVLDSLMSQIDYIDAQLADTSQMSSAEVNTLINRRNDISDRYNTAQSSTSLQVMQDEIRNTDALTEQDNIVEELRARAKAEFMASQKYRRVKGQNFYGDLEEDDNTDGKASANVKKRNANIDRIEADIAELSERWDTEFEDYLEREQWAREAELQRIKEALQNRLEQETDLAENVREKLVDKLKEIDAAISEESGLTARESKKKSLEREQYKQTTARNRAQRVVDQEERKKGKQAFSDFITGGRSGKLGKQGESWTKAGDAMSKVGGKIGKFGGFVSKAGGMLSKFAGPVGMAIQALQLLADGAKAVAEAEAKMAEIQNERNTARTQRNIELSKLDTQSLVDQMETATAIGLNKLQTEGSIALGQQQIDNRERLSQMQTRNDSITNGFNSTAWDALNRSIDIEASKEKLSIMAETERGKTRRAETLKTQELAGREALREVDAKLIDQELRATETRLNQEERDLRREHPYGVMGAEAILGADTSANNVYGPGSPSGKVYGDVEAAYNPNMGLATASGVVESIPIIGGIATSAADAAYMHQDTMAKQKLVNEKNQLDSLKALTENTTTLSNTFLSSKTQIADAAADLYKGIKDARIDAQAEQLHTMAQFSQKVEQWALKFDKTMRNSAAGKGFTTREQNAQYGAYMNQVTQHLAHQWGLKNEEIFQMQDSYGANTGRSLVGSMNDLDKTAAVGKYLGDNKLAVELASSTEIFNMGMSSTMDMVWDMTKKVNKMGLDGRKYMKDIAQNLKMAQKYDFRGGVQGLMEMTKWAQNVRFNMSNIPALLDNIMGGGLEGIITKAAKLQVLGGRFAMGADPLAMTWETYNDPEALAKRVNDMTKGMGYWDSKTGQVKFNQVDTERLRALAEYTNQSLEDVKNQASYSVKESQVGQYINSGLNSEQYSSLVNKAYYDAEKGWMVNTITGNPMEIGQINSDNIRMVQAETHDGVVEQALQEIVGHLDKETGLSEEEMAKFAEAITNLGVLEENQKARYEAQSKFFNENFNVNLAEVVKNINAATNKFKEDLHKDTKDPIEAATDAIATVNGTLNTINGNIDAIAKNMKVDLPDVENPKASESMAASIATAFNVNNKGTYDDWKKLSDIANTTYGSETFNKLYGDIIGRGSSTQDRWFRSLTDAQKNAIREDPEAFYYTLVEMAKNGDNAVGNRHLSALKTSDSITSGNGSPMSVAASKVTPINDGEIAQTDPNDHAIFAKVGGPFDTLFNKTFVRIDDVYNMLHDSLNPSVEPKEYIPYKDVVIRELSAASGYINTSNNNGGEFSFEPLKVEMSGSLQLNGGNGQSVDLMNVLKDNPMILRQLTEMISNAISSQMNGGRGVYNGGRMVSFK